jgi:cysteine desulfurase / selenocysteine lyase
MNSGASSERFAAFRKNFPGAQRSIYLDVAARGLISTSVRKAADGYLDDRMYGNLDKAKAFALIEETRENFAAMINASPNEISLTKNVSDGISAFAAAQPWQAGDNVVICESIEHPANIFIWQALACAHGVVVKKVQQSNNRIALEALLAAVDERTRVITVSSVSFSPGLRFSLQELGAICRSRNVLLLVDGAQSIGVLSLDVIRDHVDALSVSTQKGLLALYGMGFLYVREAVAEQLKPVYLSRMGVDLGSSHEASSGSNEDYRLAKGARRFDVGNFNYVAAAAVNQSMKELRALGAAEIETYVCSLTRHLAGKLEAIGVPLIVSSQDSDLVHMVAVGHVLGTQHDATDDPALLDLHRRLEARHVRHTIRRGILRISLHAYNNMSDVEQVIETADEWMRPRGRPASANVGVA